MTIGIHYTITFEVLDSDGSYTGDPEDVTQFCVGMSQIKASLEGKDVDFGLFTYNNVTLTVDNSFNQFGSFFPISSHRTKVVISYTDLEDTTVEIFNGIINGLATTEKDIQLKFRILGTEGSLSLFTVPAGTVGTNVSSLAALNAILSNAALTPFFSYNSNNIAVGNDVNIDNGPAFDQLPMVDAIRELLLVSNSVLYIQDSVVIVSSRAHRDNDFETFKYGSLFGDNNVLSVANFTSGLSRVFNIIIINENIKSVDDASVLSNGAKKKEITLISVLDTSTQQDIADNLRDQFRVAKQEIDIIVAAENFVPRLEFLTLTQLDIKQKLIHKPGTHLVIYNDGSLWNDPLRGFVPILSQSNRNGFITSASSEFSVSTPAWTAFDDNNITGWQADGETAGAFIKIETPIRTIINRVVFRGAIGGEIFTSWQFEGSTDDLNWDILVSSNEDLDALEDHSFHINSQQPYKFFRLLANTADGTNPGLSKFQIYARKNNVSIYPIVRGNISIDNDIGFKLIGIFDNRTNQTVRLKFREIGITENDNQLQAGNILLEDGFAILLEDGDNLLLEE